MEMLHLQGISKKYTGGKIPAVYDINFSVEEGEILALVGESGSGKTTLLRLIAGLEHPDQGTIILNGNIIAKGNHSLPAYQREIGMVFQEYALFPHFTILQNVMYGMKYPKNEHRKKAEEILRQVNLDQDPGKYPHQLSGGQQQRVALARALATDPKVLLLDEPFSNLDPSLKQRIRDEMYQIIKRAGITAVFVTHDTGDALAMSDRIAVLHNGVLQQIDLPHRVYNTPQNEFVAEMFGIYNKVPVQMTEAGMTSPFGLISYQKTPKTYHPHAIIEFRPEHIHIDNDQNSLKGMVIHARYFGDHCTVKIEGDQQHTIVIKCEPLISIQPGKPIYFSLNTFQIKPLQKA